jgi:hypothetical protein
VLVAVLVVLAAVVGYLWLGAGSDQPSAAPASAARGAAAGQRPAGTRAESVPAVRLDALSAPRPEPVPGERNPFRFQQKAPPPPSSRPAGPGGVDAGGAPAQSAGPAPPPPIPLKFIGIVERARPRGPIAVLSDARGVYYGREGDVIEGRYRIVRIGVESIEMIYVDGRGRQTIRLSGS